jgi:hypothetical protein
VGASDCAVHFIHVLFIDLALRPARSQLSANNPDLVDRLDHLGERRYDPAYDLPEGRTVGGLITARRRSYSARVHCS